jgi:hypothetical protein
MSASTAAISRAGGVSTASVELRRQQLIGRAAPLLHL